MNRQAAMIARLRETGGDRISVNIPGDVMSALRAEMTASGRTLTDVVVAFLRSAIPARRIAAVIREDGPFGPSLPIRAEIRRRAEFWGPFRPYAFRQTAAFPAAYVAEASIPAAEPVAEPVAVVEAPKPAPKARKAVAKPLTNTNGLTWRQAEKNWKGAKSDGARLFHAIQAADLYRTCQTAPKRIELADGPMREQVIRVLADSTRTLITERIEAHAGADSVLAIAWDQFCGFQGDNAMWGPDALNRAWGVFLKWLALGVTLEVPSDLDHPALFEVSGITAQAPVSEVSPIIIPASLAELFA